MNDLPNKEMFHPREVAKFLSIARSTIYLWIHTGQIEAVKLPGKTYRIRKSEILRMQKNTLD